MRSRLAPYLAVVHREKPDLFRIFQDAFAELPELVEVMWDRRASDRRIGSGTVAVDRREAERRSPPPDESSTVGFVLVSRTDEGPIAQAPGFVLKRSREAGGRAARPAGTVDSAADDGKTRPLSGGADAGERGSRGEATGSSA